MRLSFKQRDQSDHAHAQREEEHLNTPHTWPKVTCDTGNKDCDALIVPHVKFAA